MQFTVNGETYDMVEEKFTFAEASAVERVTGLTFEEVVDASKPRSILVMQALVWVSMKRKQPTLTFSDLDDINIGDVVMTEEDEAGEDPTEPSSDVAEESLLTV